MRILHVNKFLYRRGGAEGYMLDVAALQRGAGHEVGFFGMQHPENDTPQPLAATFPEHVELEPAPGGLAGVKAAARMVWSTSSARGMQRALEEFRPDVVHCHNVYHQLSPSILRPMQRARVPVVMTLHDYKLACPSYQMLDHGTPCDACVGHSTWHAAARRCKGGSLGSSVLLSIESGLHRAVDAYGPVGMFVCPSQFLADVMLRQGISPERVTVLNNVTPIPPPATVEERRDFVVAGRLSHEKGIDTAIDAIAAVEGSAVLHVAGDGGERDALQRRAAEVAPGRVVFHGRLSAPDLAGLVRRSRAVLVPSRWYENQPMTILEAFAAEVPVVVSDMGGMPELVTPGVHGLVVPPDDPTALAAAMRQLDADPQAALDMGRAGRRQLEDRFGAERHLAGLDEVYDTVLRRQGENRAGARTGADTGADTGARTGADTGANTGTHAGTRAGARALQDVL